MLRDVNVDDKAQPSSAGIVSWIRGIVEFSSTGVSMAVRPGLVEPECEAAVAPATVCPLPFIALPSDVT